MAVNYDYLLKVNKVAPSPAPVAPVNAPVAKSPSLSPQAQAKLKEQYAAIDEDLKQKTQNPIAYSLMQKGQKFTNKLFGKGWASDLLGALPGGIVRSVERPTRFLVGSGYGLGTGIKAMTGDKDAQAAWNDNINPFMTQEDMRRMKDPNDNTIAFQKGAQMAGDVLPLVIGPAKGMTLPQKLITGGVGGASSTLAEDKPTLRSFATNTAFGVATAGAGHYADAAVGKLRSGKAPKVTIPAESPQVTAPKEPLKLPAGKVETIGDIQVKNQSPELTAYEKAINSGDIDTAKALAIAHPDDARFQIHKYLEGETGVTKTNPAIEGEIVDKTGLVKKDMPPASKAPVIDGQPVVEGQLRPGESLHTSIKSSLKRFGEPGRKVAVALENFENNAHVLANTSYNKFKATYDAVFKPAAKGSTAIVPKDSNNRIVQYILDEYHGRPHDMTITPAEKKVADTFYQMITYPASLEAKRFGLKPDGKTTGPARMFLPQIIKDTTAWTKSTVERLIHEGNTPEEAAKIANAILNDRRPQVKINSKAFERARTFEPKNFAELQAYGYETDINKIAAKWSKSAWRKISALRNFGAVDETGNHTNLNKAFEEMLLGGVADSDVKYLKDNLNIAINGRPRENALVEGVSKAAKAYGATKLGFSSAIQQPTMLATSAAVSGEKNVAKALIQTFAEKVGLTKINPAEKEIVNNAAVALGGGLDDVLRAEYGDGGSKIMNAIEKVVGVKVKLTGLPVFDNAMRKVTAYSSLNWIKDGVKKLASGKLSEKAANDLRTQLTEFAIPDASQLDDIVARGGDMTPYELSNAIYNFGKKTQFGVSKAELPPSWKNSAMGEALTQLKSFGYESVQLNAKLLNMGRKTGNYLPLVKNILYTFGTGVATQKVIDLILRTPEQRKDKKWTESVMDGIGNATLGFLYQTLKYSGGDFFSTVGNLTTGPAVGDVGDLTMKGGSAIKEQVNNLTTSKKKNTALRSFAKTVYKRVPPFNTVSQLPVVGPKIDNYLFPPAKKGSTTRRY